MAQFLMYMLPVPKIKPHLRFKNVCTYYLYIYTHTYIPEYLDQTYIDLN